MASGTDTNDTLTTMTDNSWMLKTNFGTHQMSQNWLTENKISDVTGIKRLHFGQSFCCPLFPNPFNVNLHDRPRPINPRWCKIWFYCNIANWHLEPNWQLKANKKNKVVQVPPGGSGTRDSASTYTWAQVLAPPHRIPTTHPAFILQQSTICRSMAPPKIWGKNL